MNALRLPGLLVLALTLTAGCEVSEADTAAGLWDQVEAMDSNAALDCEEEDADCGPTP